jgi:putative heme-binding domain-containing protein
LVSSSQEDILGDVALNLKNSKDNSQQFREAILAELGRFTSPQVADFVLEAYPGMENELKPKAVELLTNRPAWSKMLLAAIGEKKLPASVLNVNQVRKLVTQNDEELAKAVREHWGVVRAGRDPERDEFVGRMKDLVQKTAGNPFEGRVVFNKLCAQCHKMHGEGKEVGPDITANGRASFDQLLSNVFDPSLVIGADYRPLTVATSDGRVLSGLVVENSDQRIVLKVQGGKLETIARGEVEEARQSEVSLMPEGIEKQLKPQEIADLFSFLLLDKPPEDPKAKLLPGAPVFEGDGGKPTKSLSHKPE